MAASDIRVQPDWHLCAPGESFWINITPPGPVGSRNTIYGNATISLNGSSVNVTPAEIEAHLDTKGAQHSLSVSHSGEKWTILPPYYTETSKKGKKFEYLDVTENATLIARIHDYGDCSVWSTMDEATAGQVRKYRDWRTLDKGHVGDVYFGKFFPSGKVLLTGGADTTLRVWDLFDEDWDGSPATMLKGHKQAVFDADFIERGRNIVSCSRDGTALLFDVPSQAPLATFNPEAGSILSCRVGSHATASSGAALDAREAGTEGKLLALGADNGSIYLFDLRSRRLVHTIAQADPNKSSCAMNRVCFLPSGQLVGGDSLGRLSFWDLRNFTQTISITRAIQRNGSPITSLAAMSNTHLAVSQGDGACFVWDAFSSTSIAELCCSDYDAVYSLTVAPAVNQIFVGCRDGCLRGFQLPTTQSVA